MNNAYQSAFSGTIKNNDGTTDFVTGLTKREYFAGLAMQGILSGRDPSGADIEMKWAVKLADELLEELEK